MAKSIQTKYSNNSKLSSLRLAVLIDAENVSPKIVDGLFKEMATIGNVVIRRIYGNFSEPCLKPWIEPIARYSIEKRQQDAITDFKNASDMALAVEAVVLNCENKCDGICIVSSDGDFTPVAREIRRHGMAVYGFGKKTTPESFKNACDVFTFIEKWMPPKPKRVQQRKNPLDAIIVLRKGIRQAVLHADSKSGWVRLQTVASHLLEFKPGQYGSASLSKLVRKINELRKNKEYEIDAVNSAGMRIRMNPSLT